MQVWDKHFAERTPMFQPLVHLVADLRGACWPTAEQLNAVAAQTALHSGGGCLLRFASPAGNPPPGAADYESRIHDAGMVPLRDSNWHDLFNALAWLAFPRTKAALNRAHVEELRRSQGGRAGVRNARRDALTLFDESGVLVLSNSKAVLDGIRAFDWKRLFWDQRAMLMKTTRFLIVGHGLYEKALSPYVGMTGHALLLDLSVDVEALAESALIARADALGAETLAAGIMHPRDLAPLPVLGIPGWWHANTAAEFYANKQYFRPGRRAPQAADATD
jgi:hypothetical protein